MCALLVQPNTFQVEADDPLDDRFRVQDLTERDNLPFKYLGLLTYVIDEGITYRLTSIGPDIWQPIGTGIQTINDNGSSLPPQPSLTFAGDIVVASDDPGNSATLVTINIIELDGGEEV